jgi:hypothetical protein
MTDLDDRIKTLLDERARDHVTDPRLPRTVVVRSRRRRALVGAGAGLAAVVAIVVGAAALREVAFEQQIGSMRTVSPSPDPGGSPTVTPSPDPKPVAGWPSSFVGLRRGEIVLVDAASGDTIHVLVDNATLGGPSEEIGTVDLEVSPDGTTVYFVPFGTPERIMSVPTAGGSPTLVAEGRKPTLSPDGRSLAFVACEGVMAACGNAILVRDLASGETTAWDVGYSDLWAGQLAWLPDSRRIAFSMFYPGDSNPTLHVLDTIADVDIELKDLEKIGPEDVGAGWTVVGYHAPTDGIVVRHYCCSTYATDEVEESSVISVTPNGRVMATVLPTPEWLDIELDATGRHFLLLEPGGLVYRMDDTGIEPEPIAGAEGFEDVAW